MMAAVTTFSHENGQTHRPWKPMYRPTRFEGTIVNSKKIIASWRPFWLSVESWKFNQVISIVIGEFTLKMGRSNNYFSGYRVNKIFLLRLWPMTLGRKKIAGGVECLYILWIQSVWPCLHSSQRWRRAAAHEGDDNSLRAQQVER